MSAVRGRQLCFTKHIRRTAGLLWLTAVICGFFVCPRTCALDRDRDITQFHHTVWLAREGAPSQINALVQTTDGYLWFGSDRGLFQFDGVQFKLFEPPAGIRFPSNNINSLMATSDGGLWISFNPWGIGFLKNGRFLLFKPRFELTSFVSDLDGRIWAGTITGLFLLDGNDWLGIANAWNFTGHRIWAMFVDHSGTLWVAVDNTLLFLGRGSNKFQQTGIRVAGVVRIAQDGDGRLWLSQYDRILQALDGKGQILKSPRIEIPATNFLFDRDGSLWMVGFQKGVARLRFPEQLGNRPIGLESPKLERFTQKNGLTDNTVYNVFEDREGNIWVTSNTGVDRFRYSHLVPVKLPSPSRYSTLVSGSRGDVWVGSDVLAPFRRIQGDKLISIPTRARISSVYRESENIVWWGAREGIWRQQGDRFDFFPQPPQLPLDWMWEVFPDDRNGGLWVASGDFGLIHFKEGAWTFPRMPEGLPHLTPSASFHETAGRTWLAYRDDRVFLLTREAVRKYSRQDGLDIGRIRVIRGHGSQMFFGGELGLAVLQDGRFTTIHGPEGRPLGAVTGIVEAANSGLWLNGQHGIARILSSDVLQLAKDPNHIVLPEVYDFLDGLPGAPQTQFRSSTAIQTSDGRLWFATDNGLAWVDPVHMLRNPVSPSVNITALDTESKKYDLSGALRLPKRTTALRIEYTALSFSIPERVRFKYKLEPVEQNWHDAGNRREAVYNNLGPGPYQFRVIAANNDGLWNNVGTLIDFAIAPAFYQTTWFRLLYVAAFLALLWSLYQLRLQQLRRQTEARVEERLAERTRIAQELHDTLLQGMLSASMQLHVADEHLPPHSPAKPLVGRVLELMGGVIEEGRNAVQGLRSVKGNLLNLEQSLSQVRQEFPLQSQIAFRVIVEGECRPLRPLIRDDVYRICHEALSNAFRHSHASDIEVEVEYSPRLLRILIRDNGGGIDPEVLRSGRDGHWGLSGIKERTERIGGKLRVLSRADTGTEVELCVPGQLAFELLPGARSERRLSKFFSKKKRSEKSRSVEEQTP